MNYSPMHNPVLMMFSAEMAMQVANKSGHDKPRDFIGIFHVIVVRDSLIVANHYDWKFWRKICAVRGGLGRSRCG